MNIYDEAINSITDIETIISMQDILRIESNQKSWVKIKKALERAKKVEKLLDLYREKTSTLSINHAQLEKERKIEIENKIKALGEELK